MNTTILTFEAMSRTYVAGVPEGFFQTSSWGGVFPRGVAVRFWFSKNLIAPRRRRLRFSRTVQHNDHGGRTKTPPAPPRDVHEINARRNVRMSPFVQTAACITVVTGSEESDTAPHHDFNPNSVRAICARGGSRYTVDHTAGPNTRNRGVTCLKPRTFGEIKPRFLCSGLR